MEKVPAIVGIRHGLVKTPLRMIIDRAYIREVVQTAMVVTAVFVSLYLVVSLVGLLSKAASGNLPTHLIFVLLGLQTVKHFGILLPLAVFIGILMTLGRWYRDSEMTVLAACGVGLAHFMRPTFYLTVAVAALVALVSFYFAPLAARLSNQIKNDNTEIYQVGIAPGEFQRSKRTGAIFYVERVTPAGELQNVFANNEQFGKRGVLVARTGSEYVDPKSGDRFLVLKNGTRYEGVPGQADYKILEYESYALRIEPRLITQRSESIEEIGVRRLSERLLTPGDVDANAEWQWRLAKPLALLILTVFALVFAYTDARRGRFGNLFTAIFVYFVYANLLGFAHALLKQGRLPVWLGLWWVHALFLAFGLYLLYRRATNRPLLPFDLPRLQRARR